MKAVIKHFIRAVLSVLLIASITEVAVAVDTPVGYVGVITKSHGNRVGGQVVFANLNSRNPFVTWPSGSGTESNKVFEDDESIVLVFVASATGGTETFYLNKKTRKFTVIEVTLLAPGSSAGSVEPKVSHGTLK